MCAGLLARAELAREPERAAAAPVFFDVLGVAAVAVRARAALLAAGAALALLLLRLHLTAAHARAQRTLPAPPLPPPAPDCGLRYGRNLSDGITLQYI